MAFHKRSVEDITHLKNQKQKLCCAACEWLSEGRVEIDAGGESRGGEQASPYVAPLAALCQ
ncbi:hypothetical protein E2C01_102458 [Portunus trituberculatus]|uniref:Uncharacterized protein n=1 Tax=Portunus trituberculatus TaxID=210409 RepID=A0A5B7KIE6_PORTR|nr:hypothetical protein [Portunus trituberculatus]